MTLHAHTQVRAGSVDNSDGGGLGVREAGDATGPRKRRPGYVPLHSSSSSLLLSSLELSDTKVYEP